MDPDKMRPEIDAILESAEVNKVMDQQTNLHPKDDSKSPHSLPPY